MKHLYIYQNHTDITTQIQKDNINVSVCLNEDECHYKSDTFDAIVEYLESDNTSYIDTGYKPNQNTTIEIKYKGVQNSCPVWSRWSEDPTYDTFGIFIKNITTSTENTVLYYGRYSETKYNFVTCPLSDIHEITIGLNNLIVNGTSTSITRNTFQSTVNLNLFKGTNSVTAGIRIYYLKIYENNILIQDLIPVRKNGIGYMYDRISGKLFGNSGTGDFIIGPDLYDHRIKYLESTGTQYIDLNYIGKGSDIIETKVRCTQLTGKFNTNASYPLFTPIFGVMNSNSHKYWAATVKAKSNNYYQCYYYNTYNNGDIYTYYSPTLNATEVLEWHTFIYNKAQCIRDGSGTTPSNNTNGVSVSPDLLQSMYLFYVNTTGFYSSSTLSGNTSWYQMEYFIIKDENNIKLLDLIPVIKDNIGYMYDKISNKLFGNAGTGNFVCGPILDYDYEIEYLESTGTQYIDTGIISQNNLIYDFYLEETQVNDQKTFFGFKEGTSWTVQGMNNANWGNTYGIYVDFANNASSQISSFKYPNRNGTYYFDFTDGNAKFLFNNVSKWTSTLTGTYDGSRHIFIFAMDFPVSSNSTRYGIGRIKYFKIIKNNILLFDGIPVVKTGIGYMYDRVTRKLFGNSGTGAFICGPQI